MGFLKADSSVTDPQVAADLKKKRTFRTFSYRGIELDKLLDLSNEEVRICRSYVINRTLTWICLVR